MRVLRGQVSNHGNVCCSSVGMMAQYLLWNKETEVVLDLKP